MTRAVLLALAAGPVAALAVADLLGSRRARRRTGGVDPARRPRRLPGRAIAVLASVGRRVGVLPAPGDLAARLAAADTPLGLGPADLMAAKAGAAIVAVLIALPLLSAAPTRMLPVLLGGAAAGGFLGPDLWLRRRAAGRARTMARELPDVLDLLRVCVEAGLPIDRAMGEVGARHGGLLARELGATAATIALGVPREEALARLVAAAPLTAVGTVVAAIRRSVRHGAPLAPALGAIVLDARAEHARALAEHAARAAPKIQLVVAMLLVPAVMLLVGAGVARALGAA